MAHMRSSNRGINHFEELLDNYFNSADEQIFQEFYDFLTKNGVDAQEKTKFQALLNQLHFGKLTVRQLFRALEEFSQEGSFFASEIFLKFIQFVKQVCMVSNHDLELFGLSIKNLERTSQHLETFRVFYRQLCTQAETNFPSEGRLQEAKSNPVSSTSSSRDPTFCAVLPSLPSAATHPSPTVLLPSPASSHPSPAVLSPSSPSSSHPSTSLSYRSLSPTMQASTTLTSLSHHSLSPTSTSSSTVPQKRGRWSKQEDQHLQTLVQQYGEQWGEIAERMGDIGSNRPASQIERHWKRQGKRQGKRQEHRDVDRPRKRKKKQTWSKQESNALAELVECYGEGKWSRLAKALESQGYSKTSYQCRQHWKRVRSPKINRGHITPKELAILKKAIEHYGNKWCEIAKLLDNRTDTMARYLAIRHNLWNDQVKKKLSSTDTQDSLSSTDRQRSSTKRRRRLSTRLQHSTFK